MELGTKYLALTPSSLEERDEETKNDGDQSSGKSLYPVVHIVEMTNGTQPSTNAIKVNGRCVASLFDTGSCCTFVNKKGFPEGTKLLNLRPYDGPDILSRRHPDVWGSILHHWKYNYETHSGYDGGNTA